MLYAIKKTKRTRNGEAKEDRGRKKKKYANLSQQKMVKLKYIEILVWKLNNNVSLDFWKSLKKKPLKKKALFMITICQFFYENEA